MPHTQMNRPAIAMIELIFAIVIIGITLMSAPMLISQATKSGYIATQQEGINEAASQISMIMGYYWDENNTESNALDTIVKTSSTVTDLDEFASTTFPGYRIGTPKESLRNFKVGAGNSRLNASSSLGSDVGDASEDDIDDFNGDVNLFKVEDSNADYIEKETDITISTSVVYISDIPTTGAYNSGTLIFDPDLIGAGSTTTSTNIKRITATLTSNSGVDELNKTIILHAFSCNIGGSGELGWKQP